jgi:hypothetical protein
MKPRMSVALRSKVLVCSPSIAGITDSNPPQCMDIGLLCFVVCFVGSGLCDKLISSPEESYRFCVCVCV